MTSSHTHFLPLLRFHTLLKISAWIQTPFPCGLKLGLGVVLKFPAGTRLILRSSRTALRKRRAGRLCSKASGERPLPQGRERWLSLPVEREASPISCYELVPLAQVPRPWRDPPPTPLFSPTLSDPPRTVGFRLRRHRIDMMELVPCYSCFLLSQENLAVRP